MGEGAYAAEYDANGNMTRHVLAGQAQVLEWDAENRLVGITQGASVSNFVYDADGNRVKATVDGVSTVYIGGYYEQSGSTIRTYYYHGGRRVAMREAGITTWLLGDHLGSTSVAYAEASGETASQGYYAWGTIRPGPENELPTDYTFTGQQLDESSGLMYYVARWYDGDLSRFIQPDSVVPRPGHPQSLNRYSYVANSPLRFVDPTGCADCAAGDMQCWQNEWYWKNRWYEAHGYGWDGRHGWSRRINPKFADRGIVDEVLGEAGISLVGNWTDALAEQAARGVALFARALSAGMAGLRRLFDSEQVTLTLMRNTDVWCGGGKNLCAPPPPWDSGNNVQLPESGVTGDASLYMRIVHELAHVVDWHSLIVSSKYPRAFTTFSHAWSHPPITAYARDGSPRPWDRFAEAVAVYVIGPDYERVAGHFLVRPTTSDYATQMGDMQRLLEGWGW